MKSWVNIGRIAAGILVLVVVGLSPKAEAAVGRTVGNYLVSPTGAATYTIPLWAPRGPNGLQPAMSLSYNSQGRDDYLGVGWSIGGLSSIYRCTQTYAQDPSPAPVTLTTGDVFCMDGQRLRLTGGSYGVAGSTYQTEIANFANVSANSSAGNGPGYFEVQGRDGRTYEYGNGGGSQVLANGTAWVWYLDKVADRAGNTMTISYCPDSSNPGCPAAGSLVASAVPSTISWTPSSYGATTYTYQMVFAYTSNAPQSSVYGYVDGAAYSNASLLASISVDYGGTTVKKYVLSYRESPTTSRDELTSVQECADSGATNCLAATQFTYQSGQIGVSTSAATAITATATNLKTHNDFNGDGLNDLAYCNGGSPNIVYVVFASPSGYGSPIDTGISCVNAVFGDLTGSGQDGILVPNGTDWWYYTWNGSSFTGEDTGLAYDSAAGQYVLADLNGDGLPDLLAGYQVNTTNRFGITSYAFYIYARMNTSSGGSASFSGSKALWYSLSTGTTPMNASMISDTDRPYGSNAYGTLKALDFNGDGRADIALETITGSGPSYTVNTYEMISGSSSFAPTLITSGSASSFGATAFLDFNSDACTDYAYNGFIYVSGCNGSVTQQISLGSANIIGALDWDGDGRTDVLVQNGSTIGVYLSEGDGISALQSTSIPYSSSNFYFAFDADGDGLDDLGVYAGAGTVSYYAHAGAGQKPDLLSAVTDGYGNFAKPTYAALPQTHFYSKGNDAQYPYQNYLTALYVVLQATFSDPSNPGSGTYGTSYSYANGWINLQGRGFAGFGVISSTDSRSEIMELFYYDRAFPYTGMLSSYYAEDNGGWVGYQVYLSRVYTLASTELESTQYDERYFPYVSGVTEQESYPAPNVKKTSNYSYDDFGNVTSSSSTVTDQNNNSPYDGDSWTTTITNTPDVDTSTWCLSLLTESQVSYAASDGSNSVTRTRQFTPDLTNCRYNQIVTEPSSSSYALTEALGYDSFGNISTDTLTGNGMAARENKASWGTTGQFPMSVTDALNETTQFNYNFSYGLVSSKKDPNNLTASWQYGDGFGRVTQETRPDGTYTIWNYDDCGVDGGCLLGAHTLARAHLAYGTTGSLITDGTVYYDQEERPIVWNDMMLGQNEWSRNEVRYDSLGRIIKRASPCIWSAVETTCSYWATLSYDFLNRLIEVQRPINQNDSTLQTTSDLIEGTTHTITDPNGQTRTLIYDANGWLRQTKDAVGYSVILGYDAAGAKTSVTDSLGHTLWTGTYAYGIAPFLTSESDVDRGSLTYTLDALGEPTSWRNARAQTVYQSWDALGRPVSRNEPGFNTHWIWGNSAAAHNIGRLQNVCTSSGACSSSYFYSETETYDSLGRLYQRAIAIPAIGTNTYTWQYNATIGLLDTLTYPVSTSGKALTLKYAYQNGILSSITDTLDSPSVTVWQADAQNPAGQIAQETLGNGLVTSRAYDAVTHWLASVQSGPGGGASVQNQSFLYDEVGNVTQRQDNNAGLTENFYYDNDNRLSYSTLDGTQNLSLNYDQMGNITSRSDVAGGATWTYDPVHVHEVTQAGSSAYKYAYDADGNVTSRQGSSITWSSYDYPTLINDTATGESVSLSYDPGRSAFMEQTQGPGGIETAYHIGGLFDIVSSGGVTDFRHYIYAGSEPVAIDSRKSSGATALYYLLSDHQGSVAAITNSTGSVVVNESFTAFGARRNPMSWSGAPSGTDLTTIAGITRHGYTFQEALGQMGLNDMVGRVQDAITGRFLSADPTIPNPMDPQAYNRYSYVGNSPVTLIDPTGFSSCGPSGMSAMVCAPPYTSSDDMFGDEGRGEAAQTTNGANPALELLTPASVRASRARSPNTTPPSAATPIPAPAPAPSPAPQQSNYPTVIVPGLQATVSSTYESSTLGSLDYSLTVQDYVYSGLGGYSGLSANLLESVGYKSAQMLGKLDLSLPSNIMDLPSGVAGVATLFEAYSQYENGDYYGAVQTSGSGLGGIFGGNLGVEVGGALGSAFGPVGTAVGAFSGGALGGIGGSYVGGNAAGYLFNNAYAIGNALNTWGRGFTPYSF